MPPDWQQGGDSNGYKVLWKSSEKLWQEDHLAPSHLDVSLLIVNNGGFQFYFFLS